MSDHLKRFVTDNSAATAIEYCMIAGVVSIVIFGAVTSIGARISQYFTQIATAN